MDYKTLLFSPSGRINRKRYWLTLIVADIAFSIFYVPFMSTIRQGEGLSSTQMIVLPIIVVLGLVLSYVGVILAIKRFHDRDKSGWWVLISLVPLIGGIWFFVECGCLRGTIGRNRFGADPLLPNDDIVQVFGATGQPTLR